MSVSVFARVGGEGAVAGKLVLHVAVIVSLLIKR